MAEGWIESRACAKLNLRLRIFPRGDDGYHPLETIFCRIDLADRVGVRLWPEPHRVWIHVSGPAPAPQGPENLAARAASLFARRAGVVGGIEIALAKEVPPGSGLGGGSSDAAAVLRMLERVLHLPGGRNALLELAAELGADVPFLAADIGLAIGRGRGEELTPGSGLEPRPMLIALPQVAIPSGEAYAWWDEACERGDIVPDAPVPISAEQLSSWETLSALAINDFEPIIYQRYQELASIKEELQRSGARIALLSGSGSALYGVYESDEDRQSALERLSAELKGVRLVSARGPV
ncbi:MAG TPA: 4-(cytidine 5'-diphospho)-2-C-methyl-D-erythritol kinase [Gemmatimonadota bacterium]|nr:4-(cytidine 5'-diphospho)-2-C-methyl-D-erythritol kinase [Gemmatimonadota bacterium]